MIGRCRVGSIDGDARAAGAVCAGNTLVWPGHPRYFLASLVLFCRETRRSVGTSASNGCD